MVWGAVIGAAASLAAGAMSSSGQKDANSANVALSRRQMDWQERMSNTAHQREVLDLQRAGLNPMLSLGHPGASTPQGSLAHVENEVQPGISSGQAAYRLGAEVDKIRDEQELIRSQKNAQDASAALARSNASKADAEAAVAGMMIPKIQADTIASTNSAWKIQAETDLTRQLVTKSLAETAHILSDRERIQAATKKIVEETRMLPLTADQIKTATDLAATEILSVKAGTELRSSTLKRAWNEEAVQDSWWMRNVSPYLPDFLKGATGGAAVNRMTK